MTEPVTHDDVVRLARMADLPLGEERIGPLAELLNAWLQPANELSRQMSAPDYLGVMPITVLVHPDLSESGERA